MWWKRIKANAPRAATRPASTSATTTAPRRSEELAMLLTRKSASAAAEPRLARGLRAGLAKTMDRRTFLKRSGVSAGAAAVAAQLPYSMIGLAEAKDEAGGAIEIKRTVCTRCSVGCAVAAAVENGVSARQEPGV